MNPILHKSHKLEKLPNDLIVFKSKVDQSDICILETTIIDLKNLCCR